MLIFSNKQRKANIKFSGALTGSFTIRDQGKKEISNTRGAFFYVPFFLFEIRKKNNNKLHTSLTTPLQNSRQIAIQQFSSNI